MLCHGFIRYFTSNRYFEGYDPDEQEGFQWFDYRLDILSPQSALSIGKQKEPFSMEKLATDLCVSQERHVGNDALIKSRKAWFILCLRLNISWAVGALAV